MNSLTNIRKITLLAALPAAVLLANNAMAGADVYGKINLTVQKNSADNNMNATYKDFYDNYTLDTNASRLGFKTSADLGSTGLKGVAKLEYEVDADDGATVFKQRNIYAGVQGEFGTVVAGKFDTPMKESQGKVDLFNDYILGDIKNVLLVGEVRANNIVMYSTPKFDNGISVNFAFMPGEDNGAKGSTATNGTQENNGLMDTYSANIHYDSETLYLALAMDKAMGKDGAIGPNCSTACLSGADIKRAVAQIKLADAFTVGAIYQTADSADNTNDKTQPLASNKARSIATVTDAFGAFTPAAPYTAFSVDIRDSKGYILNTSYTMGDHVFKVQYGASTSGTVVAGDKDLDVKDTLLGYEYHMGKDAQVFAYVADWKAEYTTVASVKQESNAKTFGVGFEQKF